MVVLFLTVMIAMILLRALRKDIANYNDTSFLEGKYGQLVIKYEQLVIKYGQLVIKYGQLLIKYGQLLIKYGQLLIIIATPLVRSHSATDLLCQDNALQVSSFAFCSLPLFTFITTPYLHEYPGFLSVIPSLGMIHQP